MVTIFIFGVLHGLMMKEDFCITTPVVEGFEDMIVSDLFVPGTKQWDKVLLSVVYNPRDVNGILCTPILPAGFQDRLIWSLERKGFYTVKSGYRLATSIISNGT